MAGCNYRVLGNESGTEAPRSVRRYWRCIARTSHILFHHEPHLNPDWQGRDQNDPGSAPSSIGGRAIRMRPLCRVWAQTYPLQVEAAPPENRDSPTQNRVVGLFSDGQLTRIGFYTVGARDRSVHSTVTQTHSSRTEKVRQRIPDTAKEVQRSEEEFGVYRSGRFKPHRRIHHSHS